MKSPNLLWMSAAMLLTSLSFPTITCASPRKVLKGADATFEFSYPASFLLCQPRYETPKNADKPNDSPTGRPFLNGWQPDGCEAYLPICPWAETVTSTGLLHPEGVACVAYPPSEFVGTNFGGAAFSVSEVPDAKTEEACLQFDQPTMDQKTIHTVEIGGVTFKTANGGEGGAGHGLDKDVYLTFHNKICYQLETTLEEVTFENFEPGTVKRFVGQGKVRKEMNDILGSFRFLK